VVYTATAVNAGISPVYQWKINGMNVGQNNAVFSYIPANNDMIECILSSSAACAAGNPDTASYLPTVNPLPVPTITGPVSVCAVSAGNVYSTEPGMSGYTWNVSSGGTITGISGSNIILMTESFETGNGVVPPAGWAIETVIGTTPGISFVTSNTYPTVSSAYDGTRFVKYNSFNISSGVTRLKRTTAISTINMTAVKVDFAWYEDPGYATSMDKVDVQWSTNGNNWNTAGTFIRYNTVQGWKIKNVTLPAGALGQATLYIAFLYTSAYGNDCNLDFAHVTATGNSITVTWNGAGSQNVAVNYTNSFGCAAATPTIFPVNVYPVFVAGTIASDQTINPNTVPAMLTGTPPTGGNEPYAYQWQSSNNLDLLIDIPGETNLNYQPGALSATAYFRLNQTSANGCGTAFTNTVTITVNPIIPAQLSLANIAVGAGQAECYNATQFISVAGGGDFFHVDAGGSATLIAGQRISFLPGTEVAVGGYLHGYITTSGIYCGEPPVSESKYPFEPSTNNDLPFLSGDEFFTIYPNPTTGIFSLECKNPDETLILRIEIYGMLGERIFSDQLQGRHKYDFSLAGNPNGVYFVRVVTGTFAGTGKIIKQ
jgi:hypothetical protein